MSDTKTPPESSNFIRTIIEEDLRQGANGGRVVTRFPPEPNGYLHIGHAKAILISYNMAADYQGTFHLRFDDTNPEKEETEYVNSIQEDMRWLGCEWGDNLYFASDYFEKMYELGEQLIRDGLAYICHQSEEEMRASRGTVIEPGTHSPYRDRSVDENLDLFRRMRAGEFPDGHCTLRAKADMAATNMKLRDPPLYRIRHAHHHRSGDAWCIYPMYDYAHPLEDAIEDVTHSLCSLEFTDNRALYDWVVDNTAVTTKPRQYEFARLYLAYTVMSKRKLLKLVTEGHVDGWDDPRMPTLSGYRRRGYTPEAIRDFVERIGVAKANSLVDVALLEYSIRNDLNHKAPRVMAVTDPLKVVITNWPEGKLDELDASYWPHDVPKEGSRKVPFTGTLYIEREDFMEAPPKKFFRLAPGREVRLRYAYYVRCDEVVKGEDGEILELRCSYDPDTRGGHSPDGRKVKGTLHWVSAELALPAELRLYDRLFKVPQPAQEEDFLTQINPEALVVRRGFVEPSLASAAPGERFQFERVGYFIVDPDSASEGGGLVFNRTVTLKDTWGRMSTDAPKAGDSGKSGKSGADSAEKEPNKKREKRPAVARELTPEQVALKARYEGLGLGPEAGILAMDAELAAFFDAAVAAHDNPKGVANWVVNQVRAASRDDGIAALSFGGGAIGTLVALIDEEAISGKLGKKVFAELMKSGGDPRAIVEEKGWTQITDPAALKPVVDKVLADNAQKVEEYRGGHERLFGFFVGQVIRATNGRANPALVNQLLKAAL